MRTPSFTLALAALLVSGLALAAGAPPSAMQSTSKPSAPATSPATGLSHPADTGSPEIAELDRQIQSLKTEFHGQLDPLEAQIKDLKSRYEPRIQALETQRHDLVEAGKSPAIQDLDRQETAELAALSDQEKADIEKLRASYTSRRKDVQARYQTLRGQAKGGTR